MLYRQKSRFIAQNSTNCIASSPGKSNYLVICIASSVTKILAKKIVSLYAIFFSKIVYLYRFKRYIFEYRCPPLVNSRTVHKVPLFPISLEPQPLPILETKEITNNNIWSMSYSKFVKNFYTSINNLTFALGVNFVRQNICIPL